MARRAQHPGESDSAAEYVARANEVLLARAQAKAERVLKRLECDQGAAAVLTACCAGAGPGFRFDAARARAKLKGDPHGADERLAIYREDDAAFEKRIRQARRAPAAYVKAHSILGTRPVPGRDTLARELRTIRDTYKQARRARRQRLEKEARDIRTRWQAAELHALARHAYTAEARADPAYQRLVVAQVQDRLTQFTLQRQRRALSQTGGRAGKGKAKTAHTELIRRAWHTARPRTLQSVLGILEEDMKWEELVEGLPISDVTVNETDRTVTFKYYDDRDERTVSFAGIEKALARAAKG